MVKASAVTIAFLSMMHMAHAGEVEDLFSLMDQDSSVAHFAPIDKASDKTRREVRCLALNIYHEARIDLVRAPEDAWGVGFVTLNRLHRKGFPKTICGIVFQQTDMGRLVKVRIGKKVSYIETVAQFSWTVYDINKLVPHEKDAWMVVQQIAWDLYTHPHLTDITNGATHFFAPSLASPKWRKQGIEEVQLGGHKFMQMARAN
jgi:Cell Wall Hydrolase